MIGAGNPMHLFRLYFISPTQVIVVSVVLSSALAYAVKSLPRLGVCTGAPCSSLSFAVSLLLTDYYYFFYSGDSRCFLLMLSLSISLHTHTHTHNYHQTYLQINAMKGVAKTHAEQMNGVTSMLHTKLGAKVGGAVHCRVAHLNAFMF